MCFLFCLTKTVCFAQQLNFIHRIFPSLEFSLILRTLITSLSERSLSLKKKASNGRSRPHFLLPRVLLRILSSHFASFVSNNFIIEEKDAQNFHRKTGETFFSINDIRDDDDDD